MRDWEGARGAGWSVRSCSPWPCKVCGGKPSFGAVHQGREGRTPPLTGSCVLRLVGQNSSLFLVGLAPLEADPVPCNVARRLRLSDQGRWGGRPEATG